jgi:transcription elongation GreA/GreB family factor
MLFYRKAKIRHKTIPKFPLSFEEERGLGGELILKPYLTPMNKKEVLATCKQLLNERTTRLNLAMAAARETANNETKSSAGDKYETTREMMQAEMERLSHQLAEVAKLNEALFHAESAAPSPTIALGSLVKTNRATYFLAAGLGSVSVHGQTVFVLSTASPIGQLLVGKRVGESISFNGQQQTVIEVLE